jgi:hypothetical protein
MSAWRVLLLPMVAAGLVLAIVTPAGSSAVRKGNPGGRILSQLEKIHSAIPADATEMQTRSQEPVWISSCSDQCLKKGWSPVNYGISFASQQARSKVLAEVTNKMRDLGWGSRVNVPGGSWAWKRRLPTGKAPKLRLPTLLEREGTLPGTSERQPFPSSCWQMCGRVGDVRTVQEPPSEYAPGACSEVPAFLIRVAGVWRW